MIGETLGSYRILSKLGEGGMGIVYLAEHPLIGKKAAVKLLRAEGAMNDEVVNRFFNEARATSLIKHSGLIDIFDFGYHTDGSAYIVMEFLEGESLGQWLDREGKLGFAHLVPIARQIAAAVGAAHVKKIVHRDLKPDNIYLVRDDVTGGLRVKVLDFGIAKLGGENSSVKTGTGSMLGTPLYMSPEQCRGAGAVDGRADIYSLGCILYEMVCGQPPFLGEGPGDVIVGHLTKAPTPLRDFVPTVRPELEQLILQCLAKTAAERPADMDRVIAGLDALTDVPQTLIPDAPRPVSTPVVPDHSAMAFEHTSHSGATPAAGVRAVGTGMGARGTGNRAADAAAAFINGSDSTGMASPASATGARRVVALGSTVAPVEAPIPTEPRASLKELRGSTTLGQSMGESKPQVAAPAPAGRKVPMWAVGAGLAVAAGVGLFVFMRGNDAKKPDPAVSAANQPTPVSPAPTPAAAEMPAPATPALISLNIRSEPAGAAILRVLDGAQIGTTPYVEELPQGKGEAKYVLRLEGYQDEEVALSLASAGEVNAQLKEKKGGKRKGPAGVAGTGAGKPGAGKPGAGKPAAGTVHKDDTLGFE